MEPMAVFPPGLVWLASYPKSGNTWMRVLLSNLKTNSALPADINNLSSDETLIGLWRFGDDMLTDPDLLLWHEVEQMRAIQCDFAATHLKTPVFCKTHDRFTGRSGAPVLGTSARAALYLVRDPRDVAVSLSHHASLPLDDVITLMADETRLSGGGLQVRYLLGDWDGHVAGWTGQDLIPTMVVRYEDMHDDTEATLGDILTFLGATVSAERIRHAVGLSSLTELQRQEAENGFRERQSGQKQFFRSGRVGEWRDVLTTSQIRTIETRFATNMTRLGYRPELS